MKLEVFRNAGFEIRGGLIESEPYFVAMDIAKALGYKDTEAMTRRLDNDEVQNLQIVGFGNRGINVVNESGLYSAILGSQKPEAKRFKKWVTAEVLPSIRKHGAYLTPEKVEEALLNPDTIIQLATQLKAERAEKEKYLKEVEAQKPIVTFAKRIGSCAGTLSIQDFAKVISDKTKYTIGQNRLYKLLRDNGYLQRDNKPYQRYVDMGVFELKEGHYTNTSTGEDVIYTKTRVTPKGQKYLIEKLDEMLMQKSA